MTVQIIAENILDEDDFLSATEEEGIYIGQPVPDSGNTGSFRPIATGIPADFSYSGTATGDGAAGGTTVIDSNLDIYGDDLFIDGLIAITSGGASGESQTVTDFARATGTLTSAAFSIQIVTGVTFTLTIDKDSRDFRIELVGSGDARDADFKWSHDGGAIYFGRDDPDAANWENDTTISQDMRNTFSSSNCVLIEDLGDDNWICVFGSDSLGTVAMTSSSNAGRSWGALATIIAATYAYDLIRLKSGRLVVGTYKQAGGLFQHYYSDDDGITWAYLGEPISTTKAGLKELNDGTLIAVYELGNVVYSKKSNDGGKTWTAQVTIASDVNSQYSPSVEQASNGDVVVVYATDEDAINDIEIKCKISTDGGSTWGSAIDVLDFVADFKYPSITKDVDGTLFVAAMTGNDVYFTTSADHGATWDTAGTVLLNPAYTANLAPKIKAVGGYRIVCAFPDTNTDPAAYYAQFVQRGYVGAYVATGIPCSPDGNDLINNVRIHWHGGAGITGDKFSFTPEYDYRMANIITHNRLEYWLSEQDNIACSIVIDMGANVRFLADGVAFFGSNLRTLSYQMNATDSWGAPTVDESVSFDVEASCTVDASGVNGNMIKDASVLADYEDHFFSCEGKDEVYYVRMTSGADDNETYKIKDNVGDWLVLDTTAAIGVAAADTFAIYQSFVADTFTEGVRRFIRVNIAAQKTDEGYYQLGIMIAGKTISLTKTYRQGWIKTNSQRIDFLGYEAGGLHPIKRANRKRTFDLFWSSDETTRKEITAIYEYLEGKNLCFIPDSSDLTDCYLCKMFGDIRAVNIQNNMFDFSIRLIEV